MRTRHRPWFPLRGTGPRPGLGPRRVKSPTRGGFALAWVILAMLLALVLVGILWSQGADRRRRSLREQLTLRVELLGKGGFAHALHKVEKTAIYFDRRMVEGRSRMDVGAEDPEYLADLRGEVEYQDGSGNYRIVAMVVHRQKTVRGDVVLKVEMLVDAVVEVGKTRRRERLKGEFRHFRGGEKK